MKKHNNNSLIKKRRVRLLKLCYWVFLLFIFRKSVHHLIWCFHIRSDWVCIILRAFIMCFYCMCLFASFYFLFSSSFILYLSMHVFFKTSWKCVKKYHRSDLSASSYCFCVLETAVWHWGLLLWNWRVGGNTLIATLCRVAEMYLTSTHFYTHAHIFIEILHTGAPTPHNPKCFLLFSAVCLGYLWDLCSNSSCLLDA